MVPLLLAATACKFGSDDKKDDKKADNAAASTTAPATAPAAPSAAAPSGATSGNPGGSGKALTAAQLQTALLSAKELPSGWKTAARQTPRPHRADRHPAGCQPVWDLVFGDPKKQPTAKAGATLTGPGGSYQVSLAEFAPGVARSSSPTPPVRSRTTPPRTASPTAPRTPRATSPPSRAAPRTPPSSATRP
ncbi:hypothetical protein ACU686_17950 [Yinghuangia aomiensis]